MFETLAPRSFRVRTESRGKIALSVSCNLRFNFVLSNGHNRMCMPEYFDFQVGTLRLPFDKLKLPDAFLG